MEFGAGRSAGAGSGSGVARRAIRTLPGPYVRQRAQPLERSIGWPRALAVDHELFYAYAFLHRRGRVGAAHQNERETSAGWVSAVVCPPRAPLDRKSTRLNSSHVAISYAVFCLKKK